MEYFLQAKVIRLRTRQNKFLAAGDGGETVRQTRHGHTIKAQWAVELVDNNPNLIRLRSCHNKLLTASEKPLLKGWSGKRVVQSDCNPEAQWEPIRKDFYVMLRAPLTGKFLIPNRGAPPWKDAVTVDVPDKGVTKNWMLWQVDILDVEVGSGPSCAWPRNSKPLLQSATIGGGESYRSSSEGEEDDGDSVYGKSLWGETESESVYSPSTSSCSRAHKPGKTGMQVLQNAKRVRLRSHHDKYLVADDNQDSVSQDKKKGGSRSARWTVEYVKDGFIHLKSCHDKYLTAIDENYLTGVTGKKVKQTAPQRLDSSVEWEPVMEGKKLKLKSRYGNFLRANGGPPPWRNTITHDIPNSKHTRDWVLWDIDVLEAYDEKDIDKGEEHEEEADEENEEETDEENEGEKVQFLTPNSFKKALPSRIEGRVIHYNVVDDDGNIVEGERLLTFEGKGVEELSEVLEKETGLSHVIVCSRSPLSGKLYPIMLSLPPNHVKVHIYVVPSSSKVAAELCAI